MWFIRIIDNYKFLRGGKPGAFQIWIIVITANNKDYNLTNGDTATITANFESISYGYATTSHKSQGSTCDHAILVADQMTNRACYVGSSRGRQSVKVFCPDFEHLYSSVKRNFEHLTGHDIIASRRQYINAMNAIFNTNLNNISFVKWIHALSVWLFLVIDADSNQTSPRHAYALIVVLLR